MKEEYRLIEIEVINFENEDIIICSDDDTEDITV